MDFFAENALEHDRIGLANFLEGIEVDIDPNMINRPRVNPYTTYMIDDWRGGRVNLDASAHVRF